MTAPRALFDGVVFFQLVRLLRLKAVAEDRAELVDIGGDGPERNEFLKIRTRTNPSFPSGEISDFTERDEAASGRYELTLDTFGLTGPMGVLPPQYGEALWAGRRRGLGGEASRGADERFRKSPSAAKDFLDIFNHRVASLLYRAWERFRAAPSRERARLHPGDGLDPISQFALWLAGGRAPKAGNALDDEERFVGTVGLWSIPSRPAEALRELLERTLGFSVSIEQFNASWLSVPSDTQARLGVSGRGAQLGVDAIIGRRTPDAAGKIVVTLGPVDPALITFDVSVRADLRSRAARICEAFLGAGRPFELRIAVRSKKAPLFKMGNDQPLNAGAWLGAKERRDELTNITLRRPASVAGHGSPKELTQ